MITPSSRQSTTTADEFVERYEVTPPFFVRHCLLPSLFALTKVSCFYRGVVVEILEIPAWKTRLRALRTMFGLLDAEEIEKKQIKVPLGALGPAQLAVIAEAFGEADCCWDNAAFLLATCLKAALDAVNTAVLFYRGQLVDSLQTRDWSTKREALEIVARAKKFYANDDDNIQFATYRDIALLVSEARRNNRAVQIVRQTQLVYVR